MHFGPWELLIIFAIVALLFGTKKLGSVGADLGNAIKGFRKAMRDEDSGAKPPAGDDSRVIEEPPSKGDKTA